jgi:protein translocase SecG subunit
MFNFLLILQCFLAALILFAVLLQKTGREGLGGLKTDPMSNQEGSSSFLVKVTAVLVAIFFFNSLFLANLSCKATINNQKAQTSCHCRSQS